MSDINQIAKSDISDVLQAFLGIPPRRIKEGLLEVESCGAGLRKLERSYFSTRGGTPESEGESYHRRLLLGKKMSLSSRLPADLVLFSATVTAHEIAELSCSAATGTGMLSNLTRQLDDWKEEGDEMTYSSVILQSEALLERVHDSVFLEILRRYELEGYGRLFEKNRPLYEVRFEVGRRLVDASLVNDTDHQITVEKFRNLYGPELVEKFLARLKRHSLIPG